VFRREFLSLCGRDYSATARTLDFTSPSAVKEINDWTADKTHGLVRDFTGSLKPTDVVLLLNVVCFQGKWARPFSPRYTKARPFYLINGRRVERQMMCEEEENFGWLRTDSFSAVAMPFANRRFYMYVFVPDDTFGLPMFIRKLNADSWRKWMASFRPLEVVIVLPRFTIDYGAGLNRPLSALGIERAFDPLRADFTPMVAEAPQQPVWLNDAIHKVHIEVDEAGVKAVAVTSVQGATGSPGEVVADHPFFFAITDAVSDAILFMGAVYDPPQ
jgi:serpin B